LWFSAQLTDTKQRPTSDQQQHSNSGSSSSAELDENIKSPRRSPPPISQYSSPHDAVLAQMRGLPTPIDDTDTNDPGSIPDHPQTADSVITATTASPVSCSTTANLNNPPPAKEVLHDPFDGSPLGLISDSQQQGGLPGHVRGQKDEELWVHLSRVLELQNQVAKMHLEMEAVGPNVGKGKVAGRARARRKGKQEAGSSDHSDTGAGVKEGMRGGIGLEDAPEGDEEGVEVAGDEEAEIKKAREAEFAGLAHQFVGSNESINAVMGRLDLLSKALTEFHALQAPTVEFPRSSSRRNTTSPGATPPTSHSTPSSIASLSVQDGGTTSPNSNLLRPSMLNSEALSLPLQFSPRAKASSPGRLLVHDRPK